MPFLFGHGVVCLYFEQSKKAPKLTMPKKYSTRNSASRWDRRTLRYRL